MSSRSRSKTINKFRTTDRVCGPRRSSLYPNAYTKQELMRIAPEALGRKYKDVNRLSREILCGEMGKMNVPSVKMIIKRPCGPDKSKYVPKAWTMKELIPLAIERANISKYTAKKMTKLELCELLAPISEQRFVERAERMGVNIPTIPSHKGRDGRNQMYEGGDRLTTALSVYYLLRKHNNVCIFLPQSGAGFGSGLFLDCNDPEDIEFDADARRFFKNCKKDFAIMLVSVTTTLGGGHSNFILYNKKSNQAFRYDPQGSKPPSWCLETARFDTPLRKWFSDIGIEYVPLELSCPVKGLQRLEGLQKRKAGLRLEIDLHGFCLIWSIFSIDTLLLNPDKSIREITDHAIDALSTYPSGYVGYIREYTLFLKETRADAVEKASKLGIRPYDYIFGKIKKLK